MRLAEISAAVAMLLASLPLSGCDKGPTEPNNQSCPDAAVLLCTAPGEAISVLIAVADVRVRALPALSDRAAASRLDTQSRDLAVALAAEEVSKARGALKRIQRSIAEVRRPTTSRVEDAADLTVIELALTQVERLLQ